MKTILFIVLMYWSGVGSGVSAEKCVPPRNWNIKEALYFNKHLILITSNGDIYDVEGAKYNNNAFKFESIKKTNIFTKKFLGELAFLFPYEDVVIAVKRGNLEGVNTLIAKNLTFDQNMTTVVKESADIDINPYSAVPTKDPLNLMSLFAKFPDDNLDFYMTAIVSFPFKSFNDIQITNRLFVYYSEYPTQKAKEKKLNKIVNKRHILIKTISDFTKYKEVNWKRDTGSGSCVEENTAVDAATNLRDQYEQVDDDYFFEMIEFYGLQYSIKLVTVIKGKGLKNVILLTNGSLIDLFGCIVEKVPDPIDPDIDDPDDEGEPYFTDDVIRAFLIILICAFISGIFILIFVGIYIVWKRKHRKRQHSPHGSHSPHSRHSRHRHHQTSSKATSHVSDESKDVKNVEPVVEAIPKNSSKV